MKPCTDMQTVFIGNKSDAAQARLGYVNHDNPRVRTGFGKLWKSEIFFPGPGKFWKKMCSDHWAMEKFWIFSRPLTLKERRDFVLVN